MASFHLARYKEAIGVEKQEKRIKEAYYLALKSLSATNKENDPLILYYLGLCYEKLQANEPQMALECFKKAAEMYHGPSACKLATYYLKGIGIQRNLKIAAENYKIFSKTPMSISLSDICAEEKVFFEKSRLSTALVVNLEDARINLQCAKKIAYFIAVNQHIVSINLKNAFLEYGVISELVEAFKINGSLTEYDIEGTKEATTQENTENINLSQEIQREIKLSLASNRHGMKIKVPWNKIIAIPLLNIMLEIDLKSDFGQSLARELFINSYLRHENSPLTLVHLAAILGYAELIKQLHEKNLLVASPDCLGNTPLDYASGLGHVKAVGVLLDLHAVESDLPLRVSRTIFKAFEYAVMGDHWQVVKILLLHPLANISLRNTEGETLLHIAARCNSVRALAVLMNHPQLCGLDPNLLNKQGFSPFQIAAQFGNLEIMKFLVPLGIDIELKTQDPRRIVEPMSALELVIKYKHINSLDFLLSLGAVISEKAKMLASGVSDISNKLENESRKRNAVKRDGQKKAIDLKKILSLVFKGGGVKGLGHIGALLQICSDDSNFFERIRRVAGTSAGAINSFLLAIGYSPREMEEKARMDFESLLDGPERELFSKLVKMVNEGVSWDKAILTVAEPLQFVFKQGQKSVDALISAKKGYEEGFYFSAAGYLLKAAAHAYVAYDEASSQAESISKLVTEIAEIYKKIEGEFGIFPGEKITNLFKEWISDRKNPVDRQRLSDTLTFKELHELHLTRSAIFKDLYIIVTNLSKCRPEVFSYESTPDVLIIDAVRASMSIPFFFKPISIRCKDSIRGIINFSEDTYVDGGILLNYPIRIFDRRRYMQFEDYLGIHDGVTLEMDDQEIYNDTTLGFCLINSDERNFLEAGKLKPKDGQKIEGLVQYLSKLLFLYANSEDILHVSSKDDQRTVYINSLGISTVDFALKSDKQTTLIYAGRIGMIDAYKKIPGTTHASRINKHLMMALISQSDYRYFVRTPYGLNLEKIRFSIGTPEDLLKILREVQNEHEINFIRGLPIDFNVSDELNRTVLHHIILRYSGNITVYSRILDWLMMLGENYIDFEATDSNNKSFLDYLCSLNDQELFSEVRKHIPAKLFSSWEKAQASKKEKALETSKTSTGWAPIHGPENTVHLVFSEEARDVAIMPVDSVRSLSGSSRQEMKKSVRGAATEQRFI